MNIAYNAFLYFVWFFATFYVVLFLVLLFQNKKKLYAKTKNLKGNPLVTLIVPAYNEEKKIALTIESLKKVTYKNVEFIIVNDGSKDNTAKIVEQNIKGDSRFTFLNKKINQGKAAALNDAIAIAKGEFVGCMDADSIVEEGIIEKVLPYFTSKKVGAVTVSVEVKNPDSFLNKIVEIEYIIGLSLFLKVQSFFNVVFVTPGPFSMYRKSVLEEIGGYDVENITEDLEIAYRIQKYRYLIKNCLEAKVRTVAPSHFKELYVQRRRWYTGGLQTIAKHKDMMFSGKYGYFGYFVPFTFALVFLGLILVLSSIYLSTTAVIDTISYMRYTDWNIWERMMLYEFDILKIRRTTMIGILALLASVSFVFIALKMARKKYGVRKQGILTFPLLFYLYQVFWISSIINFMRGKKVKWR